jgi:hypothetical protein
MNNLIIYAQKSNITIIGKVNKIRTLYLLPKAVVHFKEYLREFHGDTLYPGAYVFYSRNTGIYGKIESNCCKQAAEKTIAKNSA